MKWLAAIAFLLPSIACAQSLYIEEMTSPELRQLIDSGYKTVIIPTGGTEQNGAHLALGKHNRIAAFTAGEIARRLGHAVAAPVLAYVPEGEMEPPQGHMRFAGTISITPEHFKAILEDTARSFKAHGFTRICFIGDHGESQQPQQDVAAKLDAQWKAHGVRVLALNRYYDSPILHDWLAQQNKDDKQALAHAGFADTAELKAVDDKLVRADKVAGFTPAPFEQSGVKGDPRSADAKIGRELLDQKIKAAVEQFHTLTEE